MGIFGRQQPPNEHALPGNIVAMMEQFGLYEWDPARSVESGEEHWEHCAELSPFASTEPEQFVSDLAAAILPTGGWAVYGASRMVWELLSPNHDSTMSQNAAYKAIMDASIAFLRTIPGSQSHLRNYEWDYWWSNGRKLEPW